MAGLPRSLSCARAPRLQPQASNAANTLRRLRPAAVRSLPPLGPSRWRMKSVSLSTSISTSARSVLDRRRRISLPSRVSAARGDCSSSSSPPRLGRLESSSPPRFEAAPPRVDGNGGIGGEPGLNRFRHRFQLAVKACDELGWVGRQFKDGVVVQAFGRPGRLCDEVVILSANSGGGLVSAWR